MPGTEHRPVRRIPAALSTLEVVHSRCPCCHRRLPPLFRGSSSFLVHQCGARLLMVADGASHRAHVLERGETVEGLIAGLATDRAA